MPSPGAVFLGESGCQCPRRCMSQEEEMISSQVRRSGRCNRTLTGTAAALFIAFVVALTGCAPHQEVPPGGHREWGACAAIGGVTGGVIGAGIGMAISYAATHNDTDTVFVATPGTPSQGALQPIPCTLLGSGCATQPGLTAVSVNNDHGKKWLGLLGAI